MRFSHPRSASLAALAVILTTAACGTPSEETPPVAVATTTQLGSVLGEITECAGATSSTLMGPGVDPHTFAASSAEVAAMTEAGLVVTNGLNLEEGLTSSIAGAKADGATVLEIAPLVKPLAFAPLTDSHAEAAHTEDEHAHDEAAHTEDEHAHGGQDPHFWMDVARMAQAATIMGDALAAETGDEAFRECGVTVHDSLLQTDAQVREILAEVPEERRILITDHASFGYFAQSYGFDVAGVVVPGGSTDAEPSSEELASLVRTIRATGVPALFSNTAVSSTLIEAVAAEVGDITVVPLYVGSVGPEGSGAETYATMMLANAQLIADALR